MHQIGAFPSAWLGGVPLATTGGHEAMRLIDIAFCALANTADLPISK